MSGLLKDRSDNVYVFSKVCIALCAVQSRHKTRKGGIEIRFDPQCLSDQLLRTLQKLCLLLMLLRMDEQNNAFAFMLNKVV